jgi:hypothetical protein
LAGSNQLSVPEGDRSPHSKAVYCTNIQEEEVRNKRVFNASLSHGLQKGKRLVKNYLPTEGSHYVA